MPNSNRGSQGRKGEGRPATDGGRAQKIFARRDCPSDGPNIRANLASVLKYLDRTRSAICYFTSSQDFKLTLQPKFPATYFKFQVKSKSLSSSLSKISPLFYGKSVGGGATLSLEMSVHLQDLDRCYAAHPVQRRQKLILISGRMSFTIHYDVVAGWGRNGL